jgi:hypothetical protein
VTTRSFLPLLFALLLGGAECCRTGDGWIMCETVETTCTGETCQDRTTLYAFPTAPAGPRPPRPAPPR